MILPQGTQRPPAVAALVSRASEVIELVAGTTLKIETGPGGEEVLNVAVPAGKRWEVGIAVTVTETDI